MTQVEEPNTIRSRLDAEGKQDKEKPATGSGSKETIKRGWRNDPSNTPVGPINGGLASVRGAGVRDAVES